MRFYSQNEVEHISRRVYTAYKKTAGYSEAPERVIPEQLADILGLTFDYRHLSKDRLTLGLTSFEDGDGVEVFDSPDEEFYVLDGKPHSSKRICKVMMQCSDAAISQKHMRSVTIFFICCIRRNSVAAPRHEEFFITGSVAHRLAKLPVTKGWSI